MKSQFRGIIEMKSTDFLGLSFVQSKSWLSLTCNDQFIQSIDFQNIHLTCSSSSLLFTGKKTISTSSGSSFGTRPIILQGYYSPSFSLPFVVVDGPVIVSNAVVFPSKSPCNGSLLVVVAGRPSWLVNNEQAVPPLGVRRSSIVYLQIDSIEWNPMIIIEHTVGEWLNHLQLIQDYSIPLKVMVNLHYVNVQYTVVYENLSRRNKLTIDSLSHFRLPSSISSFPKSIEFTDMNRLVLKTKRSSWKHFVWILNIFTP